MLPLPAALLPTPPAISLCAPLALQNDSLATLLARLEGILGEVPQWMIRKGRYSHRYYTRQGLIYERSSSTVSYDGDCFGSSQACWHHVTLQLLGRSLPPCCPCSSRETELRWMCVMLH